MRSEPTVTVTCDSCGATMQAAGNDYVEDLMNRAGWSVGWDAKDYCPACQVSDPEAGE